MVRAAAGVVEMFEDGMRARVLRGIGKEVKVRMAEMEGEGDVEQRGRMGRLLEETVRDVVAEWERVMSLKDETVLRILGREESVWRGEDG